MQPPYSDLPSRRRLIKRKSSSTVVGAQNRDIKRRGNKNVLKTIFPRDGNSPDGENNEPGIPPVMRLSDMETQPPPTEEAERGNFPAQDRPRSRSQSHPRSDIDNARYGRRRGSARANLPRKEHVRNRERNERDEGSDELVRSRSGDVAAPKERFLGNQCASTVPSLSEIRPKTGEALSSFRLFLDNMQKSVLARLDTMEGSMKGVQRDLESVNNALTIINADIGARSNTLLKVNSKRSASSSSKWTFKDIVDMENPTLKSQVENVFRISLMSQVMADSSCYFMEYAWSMGSTLAHTHLAMAAFLYGHQKTPQKRTSSQAPRACIVISNLGSSEHYSLRVESRYRGIACVKTSLEDL